MPSSPSKVAINRYNRLPSIEGLTEKPASISSGKPLKERVKICYRSDLYMTEQRKNVMMFQEQLRQALSDLKTTKPDSLQFHTSRVKELKVKADELIIVLQVAIRSCNWHLLSFIVQWIQTLPTCTPASPSWQLTREY